MIRLAFLAAAGLILFAIRGMHRGGRRMVVGGSEWFVDNPPVEPASEPEPDEGWKHVPIPLPFRTRPNGYADGGIVPAGTVIPFAEPERGPEAYIPLVPPFRRRYFDGPFVD